MKNLKELPKEIKDIIISAYEIGYYDRDAKLAPYNDDKDKLDYLQSIIYETEAPCKITLIDSVS
mgnify:FL=1